MQNTSDATERNEGGQFPQVEYRYIASTTYKNNSGHQVVDSTPCVQITIRDLPMPKVYTMEALSRCQLIRIVHQYKCLLTEGDAFGKLEYQRKRKENRPIQNRHLRFPMTYTFFCAPDKGADTVHLVIRLLCNMAEPARLLAGAHSRTKVDIMNHLDPQHLISARSRCNGNSADAGLFANSLLDNGDYALGLMEVGEYLQLYGLACSKDLEVFLAERRANASGVPDYFGFPT